jgi:hypothetical protein
MAMVALELTLPIIARECTGCHLIQTRSVGQRGLPVWKRPEDGTCLGELFSLRASREARVPDLRRKLNAFG